MYINKHTYTCTYTHTYVFTYTHAHVAHTKVPVYIHMCTYVQIEVRIIIYSHMCTYVYLFLCSHSAQKLLKIGRK